MNGIGYVSISNLLWETGENLEFEKLKLGYVGQTSNGKSYEITQGIPNTARLTQVIYVFEDGSLPLTDNVFSGPPLVVTALHK